MSIDPHLNYNLLCAEWFVNRTIDDVTKNCRFVNILSVTSLEFKKSQILNSCIPSKGFQLLCIMHHVQYPAQRALVYNVHSIFWVISLVMQKTNE